MTNPEYFMNIQQKLQSLDSLNNDAKLLGARVCGKNLFEEDLVFVAFLNRSMTLTSGFMDMIKNRNLTCAGALLRLMLDNIMRLYAVYTAESLDEAVDCIINGRKLGKLKDKNGKEMTDGYLKKQIGTFNKEFPTVYNNTSGYIHFSEKNYFQAVHPSEKPEYDIAFQISSILPERLNPFLIECLDAYIIYLKLFYELMEQAAVNKEINDKYFDELINNSCDLSE